MNKIKLTLCVLTVVVFVVGIAGYYYAYIHLSSAPLEEEMEKQAHTCGDVSSGRDVPVATEEKEREKEVKQKEEMEINPNKKGKMAERIRKPVEQKTAVEETKEKVKKEKTEEIGQKERLEKERKEREGKKIKKEKKSLGSGKSAESEADSLEKDEPALIEVVENRTASQIKKEKKRVQNAIPQLIRLCDKRKEHEVEALIEQALLKYDQSLYEEDPKKSRIFYLESVEIFKKVLSLASNREETYADLMMLGLLCRYFEARPMSAPRLKGVEQKDDFLCKALDKKYDSVRNRHYVMMDGVKFMVEVIGESLRVSKKKGKKEFVYRVTLELPQRMKAWKELVK